MSFLRRRKGTKSTKEHSEKDVKTSDSIEFTAFNNGQYHQEVTDTVSNLRSRLTANKREQIENLLEDLTANLSTLDLDYLRKCAIDGGLLNDRFRMEIWPLLAEQIPLATHLGTENQTNRYLTAQTNAHLFQSNLKSCSKFFDSSCSSSGSSNASNSASVSLEELQMHSEWNQVELDVHRILARFPSSVSDNKRRQLQNDLIPMIVELLHGNQSFKYYQGFHDVCLTLLLVLGLDRAKKVGQCLVERGAFRNYLLKSVEDSVLKELHLIYVILHKCDSELEQKMRHAGLGALFALSWPITWFSHVLHSFDQVALCFDLFLSSHALMPIYVAAALIEYRRKEVMAAAPEMSILHHILTHIPESIDIEAVLQRARTLFEMYQPKMIQEEYSAQYEAMCWTEGRQKRMSSSEPQQRRSQVPWPLVVVAPVPCAVYWLVSRYQQK